MFYYAPSLLTTFVTVVGRLEGELEDCSLLFGGDDREMMEKLYV